MHRHSRGWLLALAPALAAGVSGCARPWTIDEVSVTARLAARYDAFFAEPGDPDPARGVGLLRPRFGAPALLKSGEPFEIQLLEKGDAQIGSRLRAALVARDTSDAEAAQCGLVNGAKKIGCIPLSITLIDRAPIAAGVTRDRLLASVALAADPVAPAPPAPGGYDLLLASDFDRPSRTPSAVWLHAGDPDAPRPIRVVQLSDLHVGHDDRHDDPRIRQVIGDVNALAPDLVIVTGDITDLGTDARQAPRAQAYLQTIRAPLLVTTGGHDIGLGAKVRYAPEYGAGWEHFARAFHPWLYFTARFAGWDFIGFDTGPTAFFLGALDRGIGPEALDALERDVRASRAAGRRGVILFSHAPSRSTFHNYGDTDGLGSFGRMAAGGLALETIMLDAARHEQTVLHLSGHTHWSDLFEARLDRQRALRFERWPIASVSPCLSRIAGRAALINTQSVTRIGVPLKQTARGHGFSELRLGDGDPRVAWHHYRGMKPADPCLDPP